MKRFVLSLVAAGSLAASPLLMAGPAFASEGSDGQQKGESSSKTETVCSNSGLLQLQLLCVGSIAVPIAVNILSGDNFFTNQSVASNRNNG